MQELDELTQQEAFTTVTKLFPMFDWKEAMAFPVTLQFVPVEHRSSVWLVITKEADVCIRWCTGGTLLRVLWKKEVEPYAADGEESL